MKTTPNVQNAVRELIIAHDILMFRISFSDQLRLTTNHPDSPGLSNIRKAIELLDPDSLKKLGGYPNENDHRGIDSGNDFERVPSDRLDAYHRLLD